MVVVRALTCSWVRVREPWNIILRKDKDSCQSLPHFFRQIRAAEGLKVFQAPHGLCGRHSPHCQSSKTERASHHFDFRVKNMEAKPYR